MGYRILFIILISLIAFFYYFGKIEQKKISEERIKNIQEQPQGDALSPPLDRSKVKSGGVEMQGDQVEFVVENYKDSLAASISDIHESDYVLGDKNSKVVLVEYSSPTCPHCSFFHKNVLPKLREKYIDNKKIAYILREYITNRQDLDSAVLGRCYKNEEDPLKLLNLFYLQLDNWAYSKNYRELLVNMGKLAGVSPEKYNECLKDKKMIEFLMNNAKIVGEHPDIIGTPAFFINGQLYKDAYSFEGLSGAIETAFSEVENSETKKSEAKNNQES